MFVLKKKILQIASKNEDQRTEWVSRELKKISPGLRILDAGAGERPFKKFCGHLKYVSQDFAKYDGRGDGMGLQTGTWDQKNLNIVSDITQIPEPDEAFDVILCTEVLEHVPDPITTLKEFSRLLRKGGVIIITSPFASITHFSPFHFCTGFNKYFYKENLRRFGLEIQEMIPSGNFFDVAMQQLIVLPSISRQYSKSFISKALWLFVLPLLLLLKLLNKYSKRSEELLCFEYFVKAVKR